jgi:hypothetical protein
VLRQIVGGHDSELAKLGDGANLGFSKPVSPFSIVEDSDPIDEWNRGTPGSVRLLNGTRELSRRGLAALAISLADCLCNLARIRFRAAWLARIVK